MKYIICRSSKPFFGTPYHLYQEDHWLNNARKPDYAFDIDELLSFYYENEEEGYGDTFVSSTSYEIYGCQEEDIEAIIEELTKYSFNPNSNGDWNEKTSFVTP